MIDIKLQKPVLDTRNIKKYSYLWTFIGIFAIFVSAIISTLVLLPPFDTNSNGVLQILGLWTSSENAPTLSLFFYIAIGCLLVLLLFVIITSAIDQRVYRFRFSAPFIRVGYLSIFYGLVFIIIGLISQPTSANEHVNNLMWSYNNNAHHLTIMAIIIGVVNIIILIYFICEIIVGIIHENSCIRRYEKVKHLANKSIALVVSTYIDRVSLFYRRIFGVFRNAYYKVGFKQKQVRWKIINRYIVLNFFFSFFFTFCLIYLIVFLCCFDKFNPLLISKWFIPTLLFFIFLLLLIIFVFLNTFHTLKKLRSINKDIYYKIHRYYIAGIFVPWVGMIYECHYRRHVSDELKHVTVVRKNKNIPMHVTFNIVKALASVITGIVIIPVSFIGATLMDKYNPTPNQTLPLSTTTIDQPNADFNNDFVKGFKLNDDSHSALTYNVGFGAYNHDMHFFNDQAGHFLNGQSWAQSPNAVQQSINGVARTLGAYHDANWNGQYHKFNWSSQENEAQNLRGIRTVWKSEFNNWNDPQTDGLNYGDWKIDTNVYSPITSSPNVFDDDSYRNSDPIINPDAQLGTHNGLFDFISMEELDRNSTRSYYVDEYKSILNSSLVAYANYNGEHNECNEFNEVKDYYSGTYAYNYVLPWVPVPLNQMHGQVVGGLSTLMRYPSTAKRYALTSIPGIMGLFQLRRCLIINQIPIVDENGNQEYYQNGKYNTTGGTPVHFTYISGHLDAYDNGGVIRRLQLKAVNQIFEDELFAHNNSGQRTNPTGNFVLMGADWNLTLPWSKGYEGKGDIDDPAIPPFDWDEYKNKADPVDSNDPNSWQNVKSVLYDKTKTYKTGDIVDAPIPVADNPHLQATGDVNVVQGLDPNDEHAKTTSADSEYSDDYAGHRGTCLYEAIKDVPTNSGPVDDAYKLNRDYWQLFVHPIYRGTSITQSVRQNYLPITDPTKPIYNSLSTPLQNPNDYRLATFFSNHATPSSRNAGVRYYGDNDKVNPLSDWNQYKHSIDGFLASYNINVDGTFSFDNNFIYSDHMPISIKFSLDYQLE